MRKSNTRLNTHMQHMESLVMYGQEGLEEINYKLENFIKGFNDTAEPLNVTTKIDGAPAILCGNSIPGYPEYFVGIKSVLNSPNNAYSSPDEIEAKFGDRGNMCDMMEYGLEIARNIPAGEVWQGDCLFTANTKKEVRIGGKRCITFQPNKVVYSFGSDNPGYEEVLNADFGICFHTIYRPTESGWSQSFNVDTSVLGDMYGIYIMSPKVNGGTSGFDYHKAGDLLRELRGKEQGLLKDPGYQELCDNSLFMYFWQMFENYYTSDMSSTHINITTFENDLAKFIKSKQDAAFGKKMQTLKTNAGKQRAVDQYSAEVAEMEELLKRNSNLLYRIVDVFNTVVDIKMIIFQYLKDSPKGYDTYLYKNTGEYVPTSGEGFSLSDQDGNIVKIVDRSEFAHANRSKEYLSGFEHESFDESLNEDGYGYSTRAWMLRNDGESFECKDDEEYIHITLENPNEIVVDHLTGYNCQRKMQWFYEHTRSNQVRNEIKVYYKVLSNLKYDMGGTSVDFSDIEIPEERPYKKFHPMVLYKKLFTEFCNEFAKARFGGRYFGYRENTLYIRIASSGKNWYNAIWKFLAEHKGFSTISVVYDDEVLDRERGYKTIDGKEIKDMPRDEFLMMSGNPVLEELNNRRMYLEKGYDYIPTDNYLNEDFRVVDSVVTKEFKGAGKVDMRGHHVGSPAALANLFTIFRDRRYETFRVIFVRDEQIVGTEAITSRMPGYSEIRKYYKNSTRDRALSHTFTDLKTKYKRLGADGYYIFHNHPSGRAEVSQADIGVTKLFYNNLPGFLGHIVEGRKSFTLIDDQGKIIEIPTFDEQEITSLGKINSAKELDKMARHYAFSDNVSMVFFCNGDGDVIEVQEVDNYEFKEKSCLNYFRNQNRKTGSLGTFLVSKDPSMIEDARDLAVWGVFTDILIVNKDNTVLSYMSIGKLPPQKVGRILKSYSEEFKWEYENQDKI